MAKCGAYLLASRRLPQYHNIISTSGSSQPRGPYTSAHGLPSPPPQALLFCITLAFVFPSSLSLPPSLLPLPSLILIFLSCPYFLSWLGPNLWQCLVYYFLFLLRAHADASGCAPPHSYNENLTLSHTLERSCFTLYIWC